MRRDCVGARARGCDPRPFVIALAAAWAGRGGEHRSANPGHIQVGGAVAIAATFGGLTYALIQGAQAGFAAQFLPSLRPLITDVRYQGDGRFRLTGLQLNGQSAGAAYGDDDQMDSNYPIIRMVNSSGNVYYARTSDWNKFGVGSGTGPETVEFTLNPGVTPGDYALIVSGAGISSLPTFIHITETEVEGGGGDDLLPDRKSVSLAKRSLYS